MIGEVVSSSFAVLRSSVRKSAAALGGPKFEHVLHRSYHGILRSYGGFEIEDPPSTKKVLRAIVAGTSTFIDVGANVGRFSWYFSRNAPARARIYGFEPNPDAFRLLEGNLGGLGDARCFPFALGATTEKRYLHVPVDDKGNPVTALSWIGGTTPVAAESVVEVEVNSLDGLIDDGRLHPEPPILLKLDVEGAEQEVLEGAEGLVSKHKPVIYFECEMRHLERSGRSWEAIWEFLTARGYVIWAESEGRFVQCPMIHPRGSNYLATHNAFELGVGNVVTVAELVDILKISQTG